MNYEMSFQEIRIRELERIIMEQLDLEELKEVQEYIMLSDIQVDVLAKEPTGFSKKEMELIDKVQELSKKPKVSRYIKLKDLEHDITEAVVNEEYPVLH